MISRRMVLIAALLFLSSPALRAQFGGRPGDVVIYAISYNGSGDMLAVPPSTANSSQNLANFKVTPLDSVPISLSDPFPLERRVFYMTQTETFQVGTDYENTLGLHRLYVFPVKIFQFEGLTNPFGAFLGNPNAFLNFPSGLDFVDDLALETIRVITWFPGPWPFIVPTDRPGPGRPPEIPGYQYFFSLPNVLILPSLRAWTNLSTAYPGANWQSGIDQKLLDRDPQIGDTVRQLRLRPGKQTPLFRIPGHTHLFILQGSATITPAGGAPVTMNKYDYAFLPENFAVTLSNPDKYDGPGAP